MRSVWPPRPRVGTAREAMETARLAAQETHVRRAALAEQFAETHCVLAEVLAALAPEADVASWEQSLTRCAPTSRSWGRSTWRPSMS